MTWLIPLSPFAVLIASMIYAEKRNWGFAARLGFTALVTFPTVIIAGMIMATM